MKYYIIAGEASGDLHASYLMKEIAYFDKNAEFRYFGGDLMQKQGGTLVKHYKELAFMGLWEVLKNIKTISKNLAFCKNDILDFEPDAVIFVDYPGFNLQIAKFTHKNDFKNFYYISPKIWAWKENRVKQIKKNIDKLFVIFPFEIDFYKKHNYKAIYFGNPTVEIVSEQLEQTFDKQLFIEKNKLTNKPLIALLPGSRVQEIIKMLPIYSKIAAKFLDFQFVVAGMSVIDRDIYSKNIFGENISFILDETYNLLKLSHAAIVTSGTATLETALFGVPQVVCYKTSRLTYFAAKNILKIRHISLVNIILKKTAVAEIIQEDIENRTVKELQKILYDENYQAQMKCNYLELAKILGDSGSPEKTAKEIVSDAKSS